MDNFEYNYEYNFGHVCVQSTVKTSEVWNLFKVYNKDTRTTSVTSFWCLYSEPWTDFIHCYEVSIVDFEQINAG